MSVYEIGNYKKEKQKTIAKTSPLPETLRDMKPKSHISNNGYRKYFKINRPAGIEID